MQVNGYRVSRSENVLAKSLIKKKVPFVRQKRVGHYSVDFFVEPNVIVEVEGAHHKSPQGSARDVYRQRYLEQLGNVVLRFDGTGVIRNPDSCVSVISDAIKNPGKYKMFI